MQITMTICDDNVCQPNDDSDPIEADGIDVYIVDHVRQAYAVIMEVFAR